VRRIWHALIIIILAALFIFSVLIILGWAKSRHESSSDNQSIFDYAGHAWEILVSQGNHLPENELLIEQDTEPVQCGYQWATMPLPDVSGEILEAFRKAGHNEVSVTAEAFGENCIHPETGQIIKFLTMQTDIFILSRVQNLTEKEEIGKKLVEYILVVEGIPEDSLPGTQPGDVRVTFVTQNGEINLWFPYEQGLQAVKDGLSGMDLLEALGY
jgi:hypothetical protein